VLWGENKTVKGMDPKADNIYTVETEPLKTCNLEFPIGSYDHLIRGYSDR